MPIYEFFCEKHGRFEKLLPMSRSDITATFCELREDCDELAERIPSVCSMQPDKYWAGQTIFDRYVTKKSEVPKEFEPYTRATAEYAMKRREQIIKEKQERHDKAVHELVAAEIAKCDFGPDGATIKQKRKYLNSRREIK